MAQIVFTLPDDLVERMDKKRGKQSQRDFVAEAIEQKLKGSSSKRKTTMVKADKES